MTQVQVTRSLESAWVTGAFLALSFFLMTLVLSLPLVVRSFLFQPFNIPAGSMIPTFLVGDFFFVSKYAYGYSRYTWPFSPPIKRVVGLPDDRIQMKKGLLHINDVPVAREPLPDFVGEEPCGPRKPREAIRTRRWRETLPNGVSHETLDCTDKGFYDNTIVYTVPSGHVFMLGDNRDNSVDSRVLSSMGYVPLENIIGRAGMIYFSIGPDAAGDEPRFRTERIGLIVR